MPATVLIVDASDENREVLRTVLVRRGLTIWEAENLDRGLELARAHHPDVIVLDDDAEPAGEGTLCEQFVTEASDEGSRLILLGKLRRRGPVGQEQVISKPYHFAPLIHTIEQLAARAA